ncbi:hypothetical protein [Deinococcus yavapaiensis]|nr:hypothetical protein [Deinococcus yavapaiensis]
MPRFPQVRIARVAAALTVSALLASCTREADTFRPRIVITEPEAGSVSRQASTIVKGFAMDDHGVAELLVNGRPLPTAGSSKIAAFEFRTDIASNRTNYTIKATDTSGKSVTVDLPLRFDPTPPKLEITKFEKEGKTLRVTGTATDDVKVASITMDGSRLTINPGRRVPFYAEATGIYVDIVVTDAAGNKLSRRVQ